MRELYVDTRTAAGEDWTGHKFNYYILIGEMAAEHRFSCESYGVKIVEEGGDTVSIPDITVDIARIDGLLDRLIRNTVGPASAAEVVEDWL